jgi:hypothetical protein
MDLPVARAFDLIELAIEEEQKESMFRLYLSDRPNMDKKSFLTFNQYYEKYKPKKIINDNRPKEQIIDELLKGR